MLKAALRPTTLSIPMNAFASVRQAPGMQEPLSKRRLRPRPKNHATKPPVSPKYWKPISFVLLIFRIKPVPGPSNLLYTEIGKIGKKRSRGEHCTMLHNARRGVRSRNNEAGKSPVSSFASRAKPT